MSNPTNPNNNSNNSANQPVKKCVFCKMLFSLLFSFISLILLVSILVVSAYAVAEIVILQGPSPLGMYTANMPVFQEARKSLESSGSGWDRLVLAWYQLAMCLVGFFAVGEMFSDETTMPLVFFLMSDLVVLLQSFRSLIGVDEYDLPQEPFIFGMFVIGCVYLVWLGVEVVRTSEGSFWRRLATFGARPEAVPVNGDA